MSGTALRCRGVRGAITIETNTREAILAGTHELLTTILAVNDIQLEDIGSVYFTTTSDLNAEFPAVAARELGWTDVPMLCAHEMTVPDAMAMVLRVLVMWNTSRAAHEIQHVYMRDAARLRPDRTYNLPA